MLHVSSSFFMLYTVIAALHMARVAFVLLISSMLTISLSKNILFIQSSTISVSVILRFGVTSFPHSSPSMFGCMRSARRAHYCTKKGIICDSYNILSPLGCKSELNLYIYTRNGVILLIMAKTVLSQFVKEMRKKYRLTQVDLSLKSGVGLRFVRELEQGKTTLRMDKVNQVLDLFDAECQPVKKSKEKEDNV
jgi:y4mF family transcriptional regulator